MIFLQIMMRFMHHDSFSLALLPSECRVSRSSYEHGLAVAGCRGCYRRASLRLFSLELLHSMLHVEAQQVVLGLDLLHVLALLAIQDAQEVVQFWYAERFPLNKARGNDMVLE